MMDCISDGFDSSCGSSRPVAKAYLIVARTAFMLGVHCSGSDAAFPPR